MKNTAKWSCCTGSIIEIRENRQDFMPLNFPVEDIHLIVQLPGLFNASIKLGVVIDVFHYLVPHLQRIPAEDVLGCSWLILKVVFGILARLVPTQKRWCRTYYIRMVHILIVQSWPGDQERRFDFCNFLLNTLDEIPDFFNEVLW
ncbi:uncharacterized protein TNCV_1790581 [Trichonephila clavipes]|nr:uncharacterized protein TNCV_1790581 [Trichonephila clavipes]